MQRNLRDLYEYLYGNKRKRNETIVKINKTKSWFIEKINKIEKPLSRLIKKEKMIEESNQQNQK